MNPFQRIYWTAKSLGWDNLPRRILHELRGRSGWLRHQTDPCRVSESIFSRFHCSQIDRQLSQWDSRREHFFPIPSRSDLGDIVDSAAWERCVLAPCEAALSGNYPYFSSWYGGVGWPPDFSRDPIHPITWPIGEHWTRTTKSGPPRDDIKLVWESNRLTLAYYLARAYVSSGDAKWSCAFWDLFDAWCTQNPVQQTVAWGCGQEIAFRLMAILTGAFATLGSPAATPERLRSLTLLCWQSGRRIRANINYAISQENNHAISEALGLWTIAVLIPEFPESRNWKKIGQRILVHECRRQIYNDGSYVQHSLNYHRVVLDDLMWCIRLGEINDTPLPRIVYDRFSRACDWLVQMIDDTSGRVPNYGSNDGANVLPLACCDYTDYRPTAQAAHWIAHRTRYLSTGPWDEKLLWIGGQESLTANVDATPRATNWSAPDGGYYILRGTRSWLMTRCGDFRDRPHQADLLHVDLWCNGENILRDGGSYAYFHADESIQHYFRSTAAHNTVEIDRRDQMVKGPRFLWYFWPEGRPHKIQHGNATSLLEFENLSYRWMDRCIRHRRTIVRNGDNYSIVDELESKQRHVARIRWRLPDVEWTQSEPSVAAWRALIAGRLMHIHIAVDCEVSTTSSISKDPPPAAPKIILIRGQDNPLEGWESLYYGVKSPSPMLVAEIEFDRPVKVITSVNC